MSLRVLFIRSCGPDGGSRSGFKWPLVVGAEVVAPDWNPAPVCGGGLHGLPWGRGNWDLTSEDVVARWLVFSADPADVVNIDNQKSKVRAARVEYVAPSSGSAGRGEAASWLAAQPGATQPVPYATASAGYRGTASAGYYGTASAGDYGTASAGDCGTASAGVYGELRIRWWDGKRYRCAVFYVGEDGIEANTPYRCDENGKAVKVVK